ncbi:MAG: hypothetical protein COA58_02260 [Bacteroidetes bacterium]|nr:MAG: hypothetical protein COA58_02260 [Bacteroidota bacterium]
MAGGGGGSIQSFISILKENKRIGRWSTSRYKKLKEQYIGTGNISTTKYFSNLTPEQQKQGRKRAIAYAKKRNIRIYTQIIVLSIIVVCLMAWALWYLLGYGLASDLENSIFQ